MHVAAESPRRIDPTKYDIRLRQAGGIATPSRSGSREVRLMILAPGLLGPSVVAVQTAVVNEPRNTGT